MTESTYASSDVIMSQPISEVKVISQPPPPMSGADFNFGPMPAQPVREKHTVHWFRKGLRMHDNPSLRDGLKDCITFRCVFILDPWFAGSSNVGINKWRFLLQCLEDLDFNLRKLNSRLFVIRGQPADILPKLFKEWRTNCLTFEEDPEPFGKVRDQNIITLCKELNINVISRVSHTLYNLDLIIEKNGGKTPLTYHQFQSIVAKMQSPVQAESPVTPLLVRYASTPLREDHDDKYGVPTLEELGFDIDGLLPPTWKGGETEAMRRLERHLERKAWVASFGRPKMTPQSLLPSQTGLSPYLRFGCLSTRLFYHELNKLYKRIKKAAPPLSLHGQLLWREFFYCAATRNPNFDRMVGNPICVQIPWDNNVEALAKWANAQTGFPWIDAIMTQLREEGWIHHLARHAVACFLTRGDLWVSWEEGMKVFDELLLDADWSVNAGMWMWLSCSSFFQQFFHCYCPVKFGRKADPNGDFIRRYLPTLKNIPTRFIHEPWIAPVSIQKSAKCVIGVDYPLPMVNHPIVSKLNIERIKQVYRMLANYKGLNNEAKCVPVKTEPSNFNSLDSSTGFRSNSSTIRSSVERKLFTQFPQPIHHPNIKQAPYFHNKSSVYNISPQPFPVAVLPEPSSQRLLMCAPPSKNVSSISCKPNVTNPSAVMDQSSRGAAESIEQLIKPSLTDTYTRTNSASNNNNNKKLDVIIETAAELNQNETSTSVKTKCLPSAMKTSDILLNTSPPPPSVTLEVNAASSHLI